MYIIDGNPSIVHRKFSNTERFEHENEENPENPENPRELRSDIIKDFKAGKVDQCSRNLKKYLEQYPFFHGIKLALVDPNSRTMDHMRIHYEIERRLVQLGIIRDREYNRTEFCLNKELKEKGVPKAAICRICVIEPCNNRCDIMRAENCPGCGNCDTSFSLTRPRSTGSTDRKDLRVVEIDFGGGSGDMYADLSLDLIIALFIAMDENITENK